MIFNVYSSLLFFFFVEWTTRKIGQWCKNKNGFTWKKRSIFFNTAFHLDIREKTEIKRTRKMCLICTLKLISIRYDSIRFDSIRLNVYMSRLDITAIYRFVWTRKICMRKCERARTLAWAQWKQLWKKSKFLCIKSTFGYLDIEMQKCNSNSNWLA